MLLLGGKTPRTERDFIRAYPVAFEKHRARGMFRERVSLIRRLVGKGFQSVGFALRHY
jgi:hypothetical protein